MKTDKEIQLASKDFLKALRDGKVAELDKVTFLPYSPVLHYSNQKWALVGAITSVLIFFYLAYGALVVDAVHYWHVDLPVIVGLCIVIIFSILSFFFIKRYFALDKIIKNYIEHPEQSQYGIIITEEYFFEHSPDNYHIIAKENIIRLDYEEERANGEIYIELLLETSTAIEARGVIYNPKEYDLKKWVEA